VPTNGTIRQIILTDYVVQPPDGKQLKFVFNNKTFTEQTNTSMLATFLNVGTSQGLVFQPIQINAGETIDLIIDNENPYPHPFHLHGHHAWVVARGILNYGDYNAASRSSIVYNTINPVYRDTYNCMGGSYIVIRFRADNPGVWIMHCHNDWHVNMGMAIVFAEATDTLRNTYATNNLGVGIPEQCET